MGESIYRWAHAKTACPTEGDTPQTIQTTSKRSLTQWELTLLHQISSSTASSDSLIGQVQKQLKDEADKLTKRLISASADEGRDRIAGKIQAYHDAVVIIEDTVKRFRLNEGEAA